MVELRTAQKQDDIEFWAWIRAVFTSHVDYPSDSYLCVASRVGFSVEGVVRSKYGHDDQWKSLDEAAVNYLKVG